jgi:Tfp pilus assembly protein PilE
MRDQYEYHPNRLRRALALIFVAALLSVTSAAHQNSVQKSHRSRAASRTSRVHELVDVDQLKKFFQDDAGKVRLVALVSPT